MGGFLGVAIAKVRGALDRGKKLRQLLGHLYDGLTCAAPAHGLRIADDFWLIGAGKQDLDGWITRQKGERACLNKHSAALFYVVHEIEGIALCQVMIKVKILSDDTVEVWQLLAKQFVRREFNE
jgi:hypothetical protein